MKKRKKEKKLSSTPDQSLPWVFEDKPDSYCLTTRFVLEQKIPILRIYHDAEDDIWMFFPYLPYETKDKPIQTTLRLIVSTHPYVREFADLPSGWKAERPDVKGEWTRKRDEQF